MYFVEDLYLLDSVIKILSAHMYSSSFIASLLIFTAIDINRKGPDLISYNIDNKQTFKRINYRLLFMGEYSELTITTAERSWLVHRAIICPQSGFFKVSRSTHITMRKMPPADTQSQKSQTENLFLLDNNPKAIALMIMYLRKNLYTDIPSTLASLRTISKARNRTIP